MNAFKKKATPYFLILPTVIALVLFSVYPFVSGLLYSFTDIKFVGGIAKWVGLANFKSLLTGTSSMAPYFAKAFGQNFIWTVSVILGQLILGYITALLLNEKLPGRGVFRTLILLPWAIPSVVMALTWQWMYDPFYGLVNYYLKAFGLIKAYEIWVMQQNSPLWPLVVVAIWRGLPFMAIMLLSGLQSIPNELYEAAKVDGASAVQRFRFITLPLMRPVTVVVTMLTTMWWWNSFDIQKVMEPTMSLGQYTTTLPLLAWYDSFQWKHLGRGAAISMISMLVMLIFIVYNARRELGTVKETL
jgi:ABC-type sugar transport system permease subunit